MKKWYLVLALALMGVGLGATKNWNSSKSNTVTAVWHGMDASEGLELPDAVFVAEGTLEDVYDPADPPEFVATGDKCRAEKGLWANARGGNGFCFRMLKAQRHGSGSISAYGGRGATVGASAGPGKGPEMLVLVFGDALVVLPLDISYTQTEEDCEEAGSQWWEEGDGVCVILLQPVGRNDIAVEEEGVN